MFFVFYYRYRNKWRSFLVLGFYLLTLILIVLSKSATAVVAILILNFVFFLLQLWLNIRNKLKALHYYLVGGVSFIAFLFAYFNLDFLLALLGKDKTLTGRSDLWVYLLDKVIIKQPWFGYGYGAFWNIQEYRVKMTQRIGWGSQVLVADNGFLDILIHLGVIGLTISIIILLMTFIRSLKTILRDPEDIFSFFPLFFLIYAVLVNMTFSLFMETELFIWMMIVYMLVTLIKESPGPTKTPLS